MKNMKTLFVTLGLFASVGLFTSWLITNSNEPNMANNVGDQLEIVQTAPIEDVSSTNLYIGEPDAKVSIIEYVDYKCPNCNRFHRDTGKELENKYVNSGEAKFEIRLIALLGPDSGRSAQSAYCANDQGIFVEFHNALLDYIWENHYKNGDYSDEFKDILTEDVLVSVAEPLGLDASEFRECIKANKHESQVEKNAERARNDEVLGTPGFKIGEQKFSGTQPISVFETLIELELEEE